jgi:hypothetical protein
MPPRVARELFGKQPTATPMTPLRAAAGRATTQAAAVAIDDELIALKLNVAQDMQQIQGFHGKHWVITGEEKNKRTVWKWFVRQLRLVLVTQHAAFNDLISFTEIELEAGAMFSRVANAHLHSCILQLTDGNARAVVEANAEPSERDGHRALVSLAEFFSPRDAGRGDTLIQMIANVSIGPSGDPAWPMIELQTLREEYFDEVGAERDEQRITADLYNALTDDYLLAIAKYQNDPMISIVGFQAAVREVYQRRERQKQRRSPPVAMPAEALPGGSHNNNNDTRGKQGSREPAGTGGYQGKEENRRIFKECPPNFRCSLCKGTGHYTDRCPLITVAAELVAPAAAARNRGSPSPPKAAAAEIDDDKYGGAFLEYLPLIAQVAERTGSPGPRSGLCGSVDDQEASTSGSDWVFMPAPSSPPQPARSLLSPGTSSPPRSPRETARSTTWPHIVPG